MSRTATINAICSALACLAVLTAELGAGSAAKADASAAGVSAVIGFAVSGDDESRKATAADNGAAPGAATPAASGDKPRKLLTGVPRVSDSVASKTNGGRAKVAKASAPLRLPDVVPSPKTVEIVALEWKRMPLRPLPFGPNAKLQKDFDQQRVTWRRNRLAKSYEKFGSRDAAWDKPALAYLDREAQLEPASLQERLTASREIVALGCDDPLICFLHARNLRERGVPAEAEPFALHAVLAFDKSRYPKRSSRLAPALLAKLYHGQAGEKERLAAGLLERALEETLDVAAEPLVAGDWRAFHHEVEDDVRSEPAGILAGDRQGLVAAGMNRIEIDPWFSNMLQARYLVEQARQMRGTDLGKLSPEQRRLYATTVEQARTRCVEAWRLRPEFPEAAVGLAAARVVVPGVAGENSRFWFDQAVAAQFDWPPAYSAMISAISSTPIRDNNDLHGNHEEVLRFGIECVRTKRFDTVVPDVFWQAVSTVSEQGADPREFVKRIRMPGIVADALTGYEQALAADSQALARRKTENLVLAWRGGWADEAKRRLGELGEMLDPVVLARLEVTAELIRDDLLASVPLSSLPQVRVSGKDLEVGLKIESAALSPNGQVLAISASAQGAGIKLLKLNPGNPRSLETDAHGIVRRLQYGANGKYLAALEFHEAKPGEKSFVPWSTVKIWKSGETKPHDLLAGQKLRIVGMSFLADERFVALGDRHFTIKDVSSGKSVAINQEVAVAATAIAPAPDGILLATGHEDGAVRIWEVPPTDQLLSAQKPVKIPLLVSENQFQAPVRELRFSPDGKRFLASDVALKNPFVWLWDAEARKPLRRLDARVGNFSHDGKYLATAGGMNKDRSMVLWNAETGEPAARFAYQDAMNCAYLFFTPDGKKLIGVHNGGSIRTWDLP